MNSSVNRPVYDEIDIYVQRARIERNEAFAQSGEWLWAKLCDVVRGVGRPRQAVADVVTTTSAKTA